MPQASTSRSRGSAIFEFEMEKTLMVEDVSEGGVENIRLSINLSSLDRGTKYKSIESGNCRPKNKRCPAPVPPSPLPQGVSSPPVDRN